jgi:protein-tyrosine phosphatase
LIDLHCHLHPGVDDGPASPAESVALARALLAAGVTTAACTSHVRPDKAWMNTAPTAASRHERLARILDDAGVPLQCVRGAEHYVDEEVFGALDTLADLVVPYGSSRWLLVETPYLGAPQGLFELLHGIRRKGYRVLLAHVERFPYLYEDKAVVRRLVDAGHVVQVNLGSLAGAYNRAQQKASERLLKDGLVGVLAGDCHREGDVEENIVKGLAAAKKLVGDDVVHKLTVTNPQRILDDAPPERIWP